MIDIEAVCRLDDAGAILLGAAFGRHKNCVAALVHRVPVFLAERGGVGVVWVDLEFFELDAQRLQRGCNPGLNVLS